MCPLAHGLVKLLDSTFLQTVATCVAIYFAYQIGKRQNEINDELRSIQDSVELYASPSTKALYTEDPATHEMRVVANVPIIAIQNVGNRLVYLNKYIFNTREFLLENQVLPTTSSQSNGFYYIDLPVNGTIEVALDVFFTDVSGRKWIAPMSASVSDGTWKIKNLKCTRA